MKRLSKVLCIISALIIAVSLISSCNYYEDEDITASAESLIESSYEINEIFFGVGLRCDKEDEARAKSELEGESDVKKVAYAKADSSCGYDSIEEIKKAALAVYTEDYCEILFASAFSGIRDENGNIVEYSRYIDGEYGGLTVRVGIEENAMTLNRTYDFSTFKVERQGKGYALVEVQSLCEGKQSDTVRIKLVMTENGWRLDTPTY